MKTMYPLTLLLTAGTLLAASMTQSGEVPKGWFKAGKSPNDYETSVDREVVHNGKPSATLKSIVPKPGGFVTLMQTAKADTYRGKRLRLTGYVRCSDLSDWAGLWLRIDGPKGEPLGFDNMGKRPIKGTTDWKECTIVLDVPDKAKDIAFGLLMAGTGQVWMADLKFDTVGKEVPLTGETMDTSVKSTPTNLSFDQ